MTSVHAITKPLWLPDEGAKGESQFNKGYPKGAPYDGSRRAQAMPGEPEKTAFDLQPTNRERQVSTPPTPAQYETDMGDVYLKGTAK